MHEMSSGRLARWVPTVWFVLLLAIFYQPVLTKGETFYAFDILIDYLPWKTMVPEYVAHNELISDPVNQAYPILKYVDECYRDGREPYWVPHLFCGMPLPAGSFSSLTSPLVVPLIYLFSPTVVHDLMLALALAASAAFLYRYLRALHLQRLPSMVGATAWMFNGYVMVWFEFEMMPVLAAALPCFLLGVERWFQKASLSNALLIAFAGGIAATSGFAHVYIYIALFVSAYTLKRVIERRRVLSMVRRPQWLGLFVSGLLLVGVSVPFVVSHLEFVSEGQRDAYPFEALWRSTGRIPARYLLTLVSPDFYGNATYGPVPKVRDIGTQIYNNHTEMCIYGGIGTLLLALSSLAAIGRNFRVTFFALTAAIALTMAMGSYLYYPLWRWVPGLQLTTPIRVLFLFGFCMSVLSAFGASQWLQGKGARWWRIAVPLVICAVTFVLALLGPTDAGVRLIGAFDLSYGHAFAKVKQSVTPSNWVLYWPLSLAVGFLGLVLVVERTGVSARIRQACLLLFLLIMSVEQMYFGADFNTTTPRVFAELESPCIPFLKQQPGPYRIITVGDFMYNMFSAYSIEEAGGYASVYPDRYRAFLGLAQDLSPVLQERYLTRWIKFVDPRTRLLSLLNIRYMLGPPNRIQSDREWNLVYRDEIDIAVNPTAFERVFPVSASHSVESLAEAHAWLRESSMEQLGQVVLLETVPPLSHRGLPACDRPGSVQIVEHSPGRIVAEVSAEKPLFLVHSSAYHRDWSASINGVKCPVLRAYTVLQAVAVPKGRHQIVFQFEATVLKRSLYAGYAAWSVLMLLALYVALQRWKDGGNEDN